MEQEKLINQIRNSNLNEEYKNKIIGIVSNGTDDEVKQELKNLSALISEMEKLEADSDNEIEKISNEHVAKISETVDNFNKEIGEVREEISNKTEEVVQEIKSNEISDLKSRIES